MSFDEIAKQWNTLVEQQYLDMAALFRAQEEAGDYMIIYDKDCRISCMSENLLEWAAEARKRLAKI